MTVQNFTKSKPKRVVILGGSGFIGTRLAAHLTASDVMVSKPTSKDVDLTSSDSVSILSSLLQSDDRVVFIATLTPDRGKDVDTYLKNVSMMRNFAKVVEQKKLEHVLYLSSDAVYGELKEPITEMSLMAPNNLYGHAHVVREIILKDASAKSGTSLSILRPVAVYGAGDTHNSYGPNQFYRAANKDGNISIWGAGEEKRDHIFVDDLVHIMTEVLFQKRPGVLNVATGQSISFMDVAKAVASASGNNVEIVSKPRAAAPVYHRYFDITALLQVFPTMSFAPLSDGLSSFKNNR